MDILEKIRHYHFEFYHFLILISVLILSQVVLSYTNLNSTEDLLSSTLDYYKLETAERQAEFTTIALEQIIHQNIVINNDPDYSKEVLVESLEFIIKQQKLQKNVNEILILFPYKNQVLSFESGYNVYDFVFNKNVNDEGNKHIKATNLFTDNKTNLFFEEDIITVSDEQSVFHVLVPFTLKGEIVGAVYLNIQPNISSIASIISSSFSKTGAAVSIIILLSLLAVFMITTYVVRERDNAQAVLFAKREDEIKERTELIKEAAFTKRIYHAHHKAEKIVGFIKEDLRTLKESNCSSIKTKISRYTNFIGRVIYDMKTYNPPISVIRNKNFKSNLNDIIEFIVKNIILRSSKINDQVNFIFNFDINIPLVNINEYVMWEIFEPLIQNAIDHNPDKQLDISLITKFNRKENVIICEISDNGKGFTEELLELDEEGNKKIFLEHATTKRENNNNGYGCFIANENVKRCGWIIDAENHSDGAKFTIKIK